MSDKVEKPPQAEPVSKKPMPHGAASTNTGSASDTDREVHRANDYAMHGNNAGSEDAAAPNLHYGSRTFVDPELTPEQASTEGGDYTRSRPDAGPGTTAAPDAQAPIQPQSATSGLESGSTENSAAGLDEVGQTAASGSGGRNTIASDRLGSDENLAQPVDGTNTVVASASPGAGPGGGGPSTNGDGGGGGSGGSQSFITVTGGSVDENAAGGVVAATLGVVNADPDETYVYEIVGGSAQFEVSGNQIVVRAGAIIDYEDSPLQNLVIRVTDSSGEFRQEAVTININDLFDEGPTDIVPSGGSADENAAAGTTVATLSTIDADAGDSHTYAITSDPSGFFEIVGDEVRVASGANIDFETDQTHDITVEVTDAGGNTYSEVITLTVNNLFDEDPTDITLTGGSVDENAAAGTTVATLSTVDADAGDSHTYAITSDPSGFFEIVGNEVRVAAGADIDFETDQTHDITVEVTDAGGNTYSEVITLTVNDLFDEDPTDITLTGGSVDENAPAGTTVATLSSIDADAGDSHTYAITSDPTGFFEIVGNEVRVAAGADIDFETDQSHDITVEVTDAGGNTYSEVITLTVNDLIDEDPTDITLVGGFVDENTVSGTTVATLSAVDADAGDSHTYAITSDPSGFFEIVGNEVRVAPGAAIDYESDQVHTITVEVTDAGGNTYSEAIDLTVNNLFEEDPTDITLAGGSVNENAAAGTTVATLSAVDAEAGDSHTFAITSDPSGFFEIVGNEVRVASGANIDFETDQTHDITVEVTDAGGNTYSEVITLTVNDLFDEDPTDITLTGGSVDENAAAGTTVATLATVDADAGDSHTYAITSDPSGFFEIVGNEVRVAAGADIDFETDQTHDITVEVTDAGGNTYSEVITLTVNDLIDEDPTDITLTGGNVDENAVAGTTVATLSAVDADAGDSHTFAITSDPSGFFEIVGNEVRVASGATIDFEADQTHDITVEVTDAGGNTYSEVITLTVNNLFDEDPTDITLTGGSVDENAAAGTTVAMLSAVDADAGDSHSYAITSDPSGFFEIVGNEVRVASGANIDFETDQSHDITVEVTDAGGNTYSEVITLTVNDLFDEDPTDITLTGGSVDENAAAGTTVATLSATDADAGDSHSYAITSDPSGFFEIVGNEVRVASGAAIDFETDQTHDITVEVTDAGGNTYSEVITLTVNDLFDEEPSDITLTGGSVDENAAAGTTVATLSAVDADAGDSHTYAITSDPSGFFEIVGNEVRVASGAAIDFESDQTHDITVEVTDAGGNTYSEVITLTVNDLIDEDPTDITLTGGNVDENAAAGTTVATLSAVDADAGDSHTYAITSDPSGFFEIVGNEVRVASGASIDFETDQSHDITVEVTDAGGNTYSEVITLTVNDLFDEDPTDITLTGGAVDEGAATGTTVATLSAVDADAGDSHTYAITSDPSGFFEIVGNEVRVASGANIDFETDETHDITVEVTDAGGNTYSEVITLTVNDLNDLAPTDITLTGGSVDENAAAGTVVATLSAVDPEAGDTHTYTITSDPSGFFEIVGNEVRVASGADIDFETDQTHDITVEVTDSGGNTYSEVITLSVNDLFDEDPTDITLTGGSVDENAAAGTTVATLSAVDADAGDSHTYAITSDPSGFFEIVGNEVRVASGATIDFEVDQTHDITVEVTDAGGNTYSEVITLTVNDLFDEDPTEITLTGGSVDENAAAGTTVATLSAVDADAGDSHTYAITSDPSGFFEIVGNEVRVASGANIDFETDQSHDITVEVTDAGGNTYSEFITLTVNDLFDEDPADITLTGGSVDENAAAGTTVATLSAVDADAGDSHTYAITNDPSGFFEVVGNEVRVASGANIDFEADQTHDITVEVTDAGGNTYSEVITLTVNDLFDEDPTDITLTGGSVDENAAAGTTVATLSAVDADAGDSHTYAITSDPSGFFEIVGNEVRVASGAAIDFESNETHDITVEVTDAGGNTYSEVITLTVNDLFDEDPTDITLTGGSVDENAAAGTTVATLSAVDADAGDSHTYAITSDPSGFFEIVGNEVRVASGASIDFESDQSHDITVEVTDAGGNTYSEVITLTVNDLFDEDPTDITLTGGNVDENAAAGTTVATLSAVDADAGDSHSYAITNDPSGFFEIVGNEVRVASGAAIDFETDQTHDITVEVTDAGGNTYSEVITLTVNDLFDEDPTDITLTGGNVDENAAAGTTVATLSAADVDAGDSHTYAITSDPSGFFEIVGNEVRVASGANIDFETDQSHDITVEVTDAGGNTYSEVITLTVNDLFDEDPTDITLTGGSVDENAAAGTTVASLSAVDADAGDSHTYAITSDPSGFFEIVGNEVRVASGAAIDFETDQTHDITVEVTDAGGNTYSEVITLTVNDLFDEDPTDITLTGGSVDENAAAGTTVATLSTVDADAGDSHTYAITSDPSGFFEIVGNEVRVAAGANIDFESNQTHDITVEVTDAGGNTYSEVITLTVNDLFDEDPTDITLTGGSVDENAAAGTTVATLSAVDADAGDSHTYAITSDPSGFFEIVGNEVRVASGAAIDFETDQTHDITIEVTDAGGNTYSEVITLTVNDLFDEDPTDITLTGGSVDENAAAGTTVATLSTTDADAGDSHTYAITSDPSGYFEIVGNEVRVASGATIDFETDQTHDITVEVTDAGGNTYSEVITLTVNDLFDEDPTDITLTGGSVDENAAAGTTVATLSAADADAGDSHAYAITSDPSGFFEIVGNEVRVASGAAIDFETDQTHDITVEVTDAGGNTYSEVITLTVNDLFDEDPTDITLTGGSVDENAAAGTTVATLSAVDADAGDSHTYSITSDPSGFFEIAGNEVRVAAGAAIDYESDQTHDITVQVTDAGGNTYSEVITLTVNDLFDEDPTDITLTGGSVDENAAAGTTVATLSAVDADAGDSHAYAITSDPSGFFEIIGNEVRVASGANIDFETDQTHDITVEVTDAGGNTYSEVITLTVNDLFDEDPTDITLTGGSVDENAAAGTTVATLSAVDADAGDSHTYAITFDPSGFFEIVGNEVRVATGAAIDFETDQTHDITVEVTDAGGNTYSEVITLTVNDLFDEDPTDITLTGGSVDENAAAGTTVATLSAVDADAGDSHTYAITSDPSGFFEIVGNEVRVASGANIDFEADQTHDITVEVTDAGGNTYSEVITLTVNDLMDEGPTDITVTGGSVDENAATGTAVATLSATDADAGDSHTYAITSDPSGFFEIVGNEVRVASGANIDFESDQTHDVTVEVTDAGGNTYSEVITLTVNDLFDEDPTDITLTGGNVDENAAAGTTVATLSSVDADAGDSHTYTITSDPSGFFEIVGNEVRVASGAAIDFETDQTHDITVQVTDAGGNTYSEVITLTVNDLFDEDPTDITLTGGAVDENAAAGTTVATLSAVDADAGDSHTYAITSDPSGFFEIVGNEVRVAAGASIDFEADQTHDITVEVTDAGGNTYSEVITLTVNDLFDEDPTDITLTGGSVDENAAAGTTVATLSTVDTDAGDSHTYAITSDPSGFFEIVGNEVRVAAGAAIDFETDQTHDITVEVTDAGGNTYSEVITLTVNDLFDEDPTDITLTGGAVDENAAAGTTVATLSAVDDDAGDSHTYAITSDPSGFFEIVGNEVRVASGAAIDFETDQTHDITVEVTDAGGNTYSEVITLTVNDLIDEDPTDITLTGGSVNENATAGTTVATLSSVDADAGDSHSYAITSDPSGFFEIVGNEVRVASGAAIDFETAQSHDITVEVTDAGGNTYSEVITLTVNDLFDEDPTDITLTGGSVDENAAAGTTVATLSAVDADAGDSHTYAITSDPSGFFEIVGNEVRVASGANIDFESNETHDITVEVTDAGGNTYSEVITVNVNELNEAPTDIVVDVNSGIAINADGGNDAYLAIMDSGDIVGGLDAFTIEVGFASDHAPGTDMSIFSYHAGGGSDEIELGINDYGSGMQLYIEIGENATGVAYDATQLLDGGEHQVSMTWDNTAGDWEIFVDGVSVASGTGIAAGHTIASGGQINLGQEQDSLGGGFNNQQMFEGVYTDVRIFDDVRTATEIADNVGTQLTASEPGLVANWQMEELSGGVTTDIVSGHDLTVAHVSGAGWTPSTPVMAKVSPNVDEAASGGTVVATLSAVDADAGDSHTFAITNDPSGFFEIVGSEVRVAAGAAIDFETGQSHDITVEVTDSGGATYSEVITIAVNDLNEDPTGITLTGGSVDENSAAGTVVATLSAADVDAGDSHTYVMTSDPSGFFEIVGNEVRVASGAAINFETGQSHDVTIEVTDASGRTHTEVVTLNINDVNEDPTDITLSGGSVVENAAEGTTVATLSTADVDAGDSHTYVITNDPSGFFQIVGNEVRVAAGALLNFEASTSHDITVEVTDAGGNTYSEVITLNVDDVFESSVPTGITVGGGDVDENSAQGTVAATLTAVDPDVGDAHTFAITSDPSGFFEIVGNEIRVAAGADIDYETDQVHHLTIEVTDGEGNTYSQAVQIDVNNLMDEAPTDILVDGQSGLGPNLIVNGSFENASVSSNSLNNFSSIEGWGASQGVVQIHDNYGGHTASDGSQYLDTDGEAGTDVIYQDVTTTADTTYRLSFDAADRIGYHTNGFEVYWDGQLVAAIEPATTDWTTFTFDVTGSGGANRLEFKELGDESDAYGSIIDNVSLQQVYDADVTENASAGTVVATLSAVDADHGDTHTYAITNDPSGFFEIVGNEVRVAAGADIDYETATSHSITIEVTDSGGNTYSEVVSIDVNDVANELAPSDIVISAANAAITNTEVPVGTVIGTAAGVDPEVGDTLSYALTDDAGGKFAIDASTGEISVQESGIDFTLQSGADDPFDGIDVGGYSTPTFADIDGDGDLDAFIGDSGGDLNYYENTGDSTNPNYVASGSNPFGLSDIGSYSDPVFADIDNDGDLDAFVGGGDGQTRYFENTGTSSSPSFASATVDPFGLSDVGSDATLAFVDIDGDGDLDAFVGDDDGELNYFENTGSAGSPSFTAQGTNLFGLTDVGDWANVDFVDIDGDGDMDAFVGEDDGTINYFENTGTSSSPAFAASVSNPFGLSDQGSFSAPTFADIDGDGDLDAIVGDNDGQLSYFENGTGSVDLTQLGSQTVEVEVTDAGGATYTETIGLHFGNDSNTGATGSITTGNYTDTSSGYTVTARNVSGGVLTAASVSNVATGAGGLGASGAVSDVDSGMDTQLAYDLASGLSEQLIIDFDNDIDSASFSFDNLLTSGAGEEGHWAVYDNGVLVAEGDFTEDSVGSRSGTITIDPAAVFDQLVFTANVQTDLTDGSDYVVTSIDYTEAGTGDTITGTDIDDVMYGFGGDDTLNGGGGDDVLIGGAGADALDGGAGTDTVSYVGSSAAVDVNLGTGTGTGGDAAGDTFSNIEDVIGSDFNDTLTGDTNSNTLSGGAGDDTLYGGDGSDLFLFQEGGGSDTASGGAGGGWTDTVMLMDADGGGDLGVYGADWTVTITSGSIDSQDANSISLAQDTDGFVTLQDGSQFSFTDLERIEF